MSPEAQLYGFPCFPIASRLPVEVSPQGLQAAAGQGRQHCSLCWGASREIAVWLPALQCLVLCELTVISAAVILILEG